MTSPFPEYAKPPVVEVVCGIRFADIEQFKAIHFGLLWDRLKDTFPKVDDQPPLSIAIERPDSPLSQPTDLRFLATPPLPRVWFLDEQGNGIIQVQRNTFLYNWRKLKPDDQYPRFQSVVAAFKTYLELFASFVDDKGLGSITPVQCELTYVNHIPEGACWTRGESVGSIFPDLVWRESQDRFLPKYEALECRTVFNLPERQGRLYATKQLAFLPPNLDPIVAFELKARGIAGTHALNDIWSWFEMAHEWIVRGFTDMTSEKAQTELWGRTK